MSNKNRLGLNGCHTILVAWGYLSSYNFWAPNSSLPSVPLVIFQIKTQAESLNEQQISLKIETHLVQLSLQLMQKMLLLQPALINVFYEFPNVDKIFMTVFTALETESIQQKVSSTLIDICKKLDQDFSNIILCDFIQGEWFQWAIVCNLCPW